MLKALKKLASFNTKEALIFVSEYNHLTYESTGLSTYSRLTLDELQDNFKSDFEKTVVLSIGKSKNRQIRVVQGGRRCIIPCIQKGNPFSLIQPFYYSLLLPKVKDIVIEFEFASYGGPLSVGSFIVLLGLLRLFGKRVYFVIHQAVNNLDGLYEHLGMSKTSLKLRVLNNALNFFYAAVGLLCWRIVVLEEEIKNRIASHIDEKKIIVIPHAVHKSRIVQNKKQNIKQGRIDILIFGYIAWYKGLDRFISAFNKVGDAQVYLTIAGGYSPAQRGKLHYETHYKTVLESAKKNPNIIITGYVPESRVESYYRKADICVLPYRRFISSSGPLSQAFSHQKPVILSQELQPYMKSKDFRKVMNVQSIKKEDIFYNITTKVLRSFIIQFRDNNYREKLKNFSRDMAIKRSWTRLIPEYRKMILIARNAQNLSSSMVKKHQPSSIRKRYSYA